MNPACLTERKKMLELQCVRSFCLLLFLQHEDYEYSYSVATIMNLASLISFRPTPFMVKHSWNKEFLYYQ